MAKLHQVNPTMVAFHCPGCRCAHQVQIGGPEQPVWGWNGSMDAPTFTPSIRCQTTEMTDAGQAQYEAWLRGEIPCPKAFETRNGICHTFVTDGKIQFLADCTHALANTVVAIPDWEGKWVS